MATLRGNGKNDRRLPLVRRWVAVLVASGVGIGVPIDVVAAQAPPSARVFTEYPALGSTSLSMLLYKFAPKSFSEEELLKRVVNQIKSDQWHHSGKSGSTPHPRPLFDKDEVAGRNPEFAARDLTDAYRAKIGALAATLPTRYSGVIAIPGAAYDHGRGVLHKPRLVFPKPIDADHLVKETPLGRVAAVDDHELYDLRVVSSIGSSYTLEQTFGYSPHAAAVDLETPVSMAPNVPLPQRPGLGAGDALALDRMLDVPPLPLPRGDAERMLTPPRQPAEFKQYLGAFLFFFDVEIEDVVTSDRFYVFKAKLLGGTLVGTRGEVLKKYAAAEFPSVASIRAGERANEEARKAALAGEQKAQAEAKAEREARARADEQAQQQKVADRREGLKDADIAGIRLGMTVPEAERIIRKHISVGWVLEPSYEAAAQKKFNADPDRPYRHFRAFSNTDGKEQIVLFWHPEASDRVLAVTRSMPIPEDMKHRDIQGQLVEKYGEPAVQQAPAGSRGRGMPRLVWTADFGTSRGLETVKDPGNEHRFRSGSCPPRCV